MQAHLPGITCFSLIEDLLQQRFCNTFAGRQARVYVQNIGHFAFKVVVQRRLVIKNYARAGRYLPSASAN